MQLWRCFPARPAPLPVILLLDRRDETLARLLASLPEDEATARIAHRAKRGELHARRAALRHLLQQQGLPMPSRTEVGQPVLPGTGLHLSLSSRGHWIALALAERPLGIDVEQSITEEAIPFAALHPHESHWIGTIPADQRPFAAARLWAAKEAYWKARAFPTSVDPTGFAVTITGEHFSVADAVHGPAQGLFLTQGAEDPALALVML